MNNLENTKLTGKQQEEYFGELSLGIIPLS